MEQKYLEPTTIIDSDHESIVEYAQKVTEGTKDKVEKAIKLFYAVRDDIWYNPYLPFYLPTHYRTSNVLAQKRAFCIGKAALLCAVGRACSIPSRIAFANVRNHLSTRQLIEHLGSDLFVYHSYTEFFLEDKWVKATPAFNIELCKRHGVIPLDFNGREDSMFQEFGTNGEKYMEYVTYHGTFADVPVADIVAAMENEYGKDRVAGWIAGHESHQKTRDFYREDVVTDS